MWLARSLRLLRVLQTLVLLDVCVLKTMPLITPIGSEWQVVDDGRPQINIVGPEQEPDPECPAVECTSEIAKTWPLVAHARCSFVNGVWFCELCGFAFVVERPASA